ncbi:MAG: hypothetical protein ABIS20_04495 [Thermoanaerobaculia bacterium]
MIRAVFALALLFTVSVGVAGAQPSAPTCQSVREQDPDTGALVQKTRLSPKPFSFNPLLVWTSDDPDSLMLVAVGNGNQLKYTGCYDLALRADGQPIPLSRLRHDNDPSNHKTVVEYVRAEISWADAQKLSTAKTVVYQICKDEYVADSKFVCEAKHVLEAAGNWRQARAGKK